METVISQQNGFKYIVADKFFDTNIFQQLSSINLDPVEDDGISVHDVISTDLKEVILRNICNIYTICWRLLLHIKNLVDYVNLRLAQTGPKAEYPVHQDSFLVKY